MRVFSRAPVFLLSLHRTGSTLLHHMLGATGRVGILKAHHIIHWPDIVSGRMSPPESRDRAGVLFREMESRDRGFDAVEIGPELPEEYGFVLESAGVNARLRPANRRLLLHLIDFLRTENQDRANLVLKNPWDFAAGAAIKKLIPDAKLLYLHRNPQDVFDSLWRMVSSVLAEPNPYLALLSTRYRDFSNDPVLRDGARMILRRFPTLVQVRILKHMVRETRGYLRARRSVPTKDVLNVQYEALCMRPAETVHKILSWWGIDGDCEGLEKMVTPRVRMTSGRSDLPQMKAVRDLSLYAAAAGYAPSTGDARLGFETSEFS